MKSLKFVVAALAATFAFGAHAANNELDSTVQAAYQCKAQGVKGTVPLFVMYGIKDGQAIVAQAKMSDGTLSQGLWAQHTNAQNVFVSTQADGTIWTTAKSDANNINRVDGGTLSVKQNGKNAIVFDKCTLDKKATAQLNG